jgi:hypothetical protein
MENKQTPVEWLISNLYPTISIRLSDTYIKELTEKAKEMEKAQMEELKDFEKWKEWKNSN